MKLYNIEEIPIPKYAEVFLFRAKSDALLYYKKNNGQVQKLQFNDGVYLISDKSVVRVFNYTDEVIDSTIFSGGIIIRFLNIPNIVVGGGGGGSRGAQGFQGAQGASGSGGSVNIENGTFTISADGSSGDINGNPVVPVDNMDGTFTMTIPTTNQLGLGHFNSSSNTFVSPDTFKFCQSYGKDDGIQADSLATLNQEVAGVPFNGAFSDLGDSISVNDKDSNGWFGLVQNIQPTSFDVIMIQNGSGLLMFVWWHGVMK